MIDIKNISDGPKIVNGQPPFVLQPGEAREDVVISAAELRAAAATRYFEIVGDADGSEQALELRIDSQDAQNAIAAASAEFECRWNEVVAERDAALARADEAEGSLADALGEIETLKASIAKFDPDRNGKPGGSTADAGEAASDDSVKTALELLDPAKDEDWTAAGLPAVDAVATLAGGKVTRAQIEAIAPGLTRETAAKG